MKTIIRQIRSVRGLQHAELNERPENGIEFIPYARKTSYEKIASHVIPPHPGGEDAPYFLFSSYHLTAVGSRELADKTYEFYRGLFPEDDVLSVTSGIAENALEVVALLRIYHADKNTFARLDELYAYLGEEELQEREDLGNHLVVPEDAVRTFSEEEEKEHKEKIKEQDAALAGASDDAPFLNSIGAYRRRDLFEIDPQRELVYDLLSKDRQMTNKLPYEEFIALFQECVRFATEVERNTYEYALRERPGAREEFDMLLDAHIQKDLVQTGRLPREDVTALKAKLERALFDLYIVQDLIDDPDVTDIKITGPDSIRCRIHGKAYLCNIHFIDEEDYERFVWAVGLRNGLDLTLPQQTFTDTMDERYILRFYITSSYIVADGIPNMEIRKVDRHKLMDEQLLEVGMMDEKIRDYLRDCAYHSKGVVFAGPPGSGKTVMLNWFLEQYESSAEILVIQENDELFSNRNGVMFEHVVSNPREGEMACSLEDLGRMALVAGANVFVIGEVKGGEILYAITLANSGCRTAITIHSQSAAEAIDKMCDLSMQGNPNLTPAQAKRMLKSFETLVYLQNFKVQEIKQITGYDEEKKEMKFRAIYEREKS